MGNSFVLFDVSIVISHGQFHCGNRGHTQNTDFPWVKSRFPVGKRSSGTAAIILNFTYARKASQIQVRQIYATVEIHLYQHIFEHETQKYGTSNLFA